jgi:hypothetical protein
VEDIKSLKTIPSTRVAVDVADPCASAATLPLHEIAVLIDAERVVAEQPSANCYFCDDLVDVERVAAISPSAVSTSHTNIVESNQAEQGEFRRDAKSVDPVLVHAMREFAISTVNDALLDLMVSWDFDGVCDTVKMVHCSGGSLSPDVSRKVRSWALLYDDVCKCMERLDSLHDDLLDLISVGRVLLSGDAVQGEVSRAEGLQACGHGDCGSLRRELAEACCDIKCATCGHDFVPGICVETAWFRPVVFTRGWSCGTEFKTVGHFIWDPPCPEKGEAIRCPDCVSA